jgi:hypothetical protein
MGNTLAALGDVCTSDTSSETPPAWAEAAHIADGRAPSPPSPPPMPWQRHAGHKHWPHPNPASPGFRAPHAAGAPRPEPEVAAGCAHGGPLPAVLAARIPAAEVSVLRFLLTYLAARQLPVSPLLHPLHPSPTDQLTPEPRACAFTPPSGAL